MGLAIVIGGAVALFIGLLLWCRGAMAAADRRHRAKLEANARIAALAEKLRKDHMSVEAVERRQTIATAYARPASSQPKSSPSSTTSRSSEDYTASYTSPAAYASYDYGSSSSSSYDSGSSCSSDGGGYSGGCD